MSCERSFLCKFAPVAHALIRVVYRPCRLCVQGYYRSGQDCVVCPAMAAYYLLLFVVALLAAGFLAAWMQRSGVNLKGNYCKRHLHVLERSRHNTSHRHQRWR